MKKILVLFVLLMIIISCKKKDTTPNYGTLKYEVKCTRGDASGAYWAYNNVHNYSTSSGKWSEEFSVSQGDIYTINCQGNTESVTGTLKVYYQDKIIEETSIYGISVVQLNGTIP